MINIKGLNKAEVLRALYNNSKPQGLGYFQYDPKEMSITEAKKLLETIKYFDYVKGRVMKIDLKSDIEFDERLYDRDNGQGSAQKVIDELRIEEPIGIIDEVGGRHCEGIGHNPNGVYCGECGSTSCKDCINKDLKI